MVQFTSEIRKFAHQGEKTGWTFIDVPEEIAVQLLPGNKKAFRVKGFLDSHAFGGVSLVPMGGGDFILPLNAAVRKQIGKSRGAILQVKLEVDTSPVILCVIVKT